MKKVYCHTREKEQAYTIASKKMQSKLNRGVLTISYDGQVMDHEDDRTWSEIDHVLSTLAKEVYREIRQKEGCSAKRATWEWYNM